MTSRSVGRIRQIWKSAPRTLPPPVILRKGVLRIPNTRSVLYESVHSRPLLLSAQHRLSDHGSNGYRRGASTTSDAKVYGDEWPEHEFTESAEAALESISEQLSEIGYRPEHAPLDFDIEFSQGVLTISLGSSGTYVINTQTPNRQIWMSSPSSGPWRYAWSPQQNAWVSTRDGHRLNHRLTEEFSDIFKESVQISFTDVSAA